MQPNFIFLQKGFDWSNQILLEVENVVVHVLSND
jgi:hypothetical protein